MKTKRNTPPDRCSDNRYEHIEHLYIMFNDAYKLIRTDKPKAIDRCNEAIKLTRKLTKYVAHTSAVQALLSDMLFKASRIPALFDNRGHYVELSKQNRKLWNGEMIEEGLTLLEECSEGSLVTKYHLNAGVSACHSLAKNHEATNWTQIISLYDQYLDIDYSPTVALEKVLVLSEHTGVDTAISEIYRITDIEKLNNNHRLHSAIGELYLRSHKYDRAQRHFSKSMYLADSTNLKSEYKKKIDYCENRINISEKYGHAASF